MGRKTAAGTGLILPSFGEIDIEEIGKRIGLKGDELYNSYSRESLQKAFELVMGAVFDGYLKEHRKTKPAKGKIKYEFKKFEVYLAVYLENGNVSYTIRLNTINNHETLTCTYFDDSRDLYLEELLPRLLADFAWIAHECARLPYTWEGSYPATLYPLGLRDKNKSIPWGYGERLLTRPMRF